MFLRKTKLLFQKFRQLKVFRHGWGKVRFACFVIQSKLRKENGNLLDTMTKAYGDFTPEELTELIDQIRGAKDINNY